MRLLTTFALLLACVLGHASANICPDEVTYTNSATNECPGYRTNIGITNPAQTSATITGTIDAQGAGSTHYQWTAVAQFPPGCTSLNYAYASLSSATTATRQAAVKARQKCMLWPTMVAGTGSTSYGSTAVPSSGAYSLAITGLTQNTTYYTQDFHMNGLGGAGKVSVMATTGFTTPATGAASVDEQFVNDGGASARFIKNGGNNLLDGLTDANAWSTLSKVGCGLPAGTNIGILNTSTFSNADAQLDLCFDSTAGDWAIVGAYKLNASSVPIFTVDGIRGESTTDVKASLIGPITQACIDARNCQYTLATFEAGGMSSQYDSAILITGNYVELRNLHMDMWPGYPYLVTGTGNTAESDTGPGSTHHIIIDGIDTSNSGAADYALIDGVKDIVVRNNRHKNWGMCYQLRALGNSLANSEYVCPPIAVPSIMGTVRSYNARVLVENNDAYGGIGEGFDCGERSSYMIARGNRLYGTTSLGFYADGCRNYVVENNISMGGTDHGVQGAGTSGPGTGLSGAISAGIEDWISLTVTSPKMIARNNLQVRPGICFDLFLSIPHTSAGKTLNFQAYGNTCVGPTVQDVQFWQGNIEAMVFSSNLFWNQNTNYCNLPSSTVSTSNHSYAARTDSDCVGTGASTGDPQLVTPYATWATFKGASSWPAFTDARPSPGSPMIDTGASRTATALVWADFGFAATEMADYKSGAITAEHWVKERYYDALNQPVGATPPKGAVCAAGGC